MERILARLVNRLVEAYGDKLVSVILYGSAAAGDSDAVFSDLNILCVLTVLTPDELARSGPIFQWWCDLNNPAPLLMTEEEVRKSTDCFPIEFTDIQEHRKVLHGSDPVAAITIDRRYWRAQLEHDLRSKLLRLRQQAAPVMSDGNALLKLCLDSVSTFCVLGRHALLIAGQRTAAGKRSIVRGLALALPGDMEAFDRLVDIREGKSAPQEADPAALFRKYLASVEALIAYVDRTEGEEFR